jgi:hypothetical protein
MLLTYPYLPPTLLDLLTLTSTFCCDMEDQPNADLDILMKGHGEKYDSRSPEVSTIAPTTNRSRFLSRMRLTWGLEARGRCRISDLESSHP